jgi:autotransporter translocation and assembly factor TamB
MEPFRDNVFYLLWWRAILAALIGLVSMATCRLGPAATTLIGANVALLFSLGLMASLQWSAGQRIVWTKAWRMLPANRRPAGQSGRRLARDCQRDLTLRFAQGASAVASRLEASRWRSSAISFERRLSCKVRRASRCLSRVGHNREIIEISTA